VTRPRSITITKLFEEPVGKVEPSVKLIEVATLLRLADKVVETTWMYQNDTQNGNYDSGKIEFDLSQFANNGTTKNQGAYHMVSIPSRWCGQLQAKVRTLDV
jgi:hypothetical protein